MKSTIEELENDLIRVKEIVKRVPTKQDYKNHGKYPMFHYTKYQVWTEWQYKLFGTTGILETYNKKNKFSDEDIMNDIKRVKNIINHIPRIIDYKEHGKYAFSTITRTINWNQWLLQCFGQVNHKSNNPNKITWKQMVEDIQNIAKKLNKTPTSLEYKKHGTYCIPTRYKWKDLIQAACGDIIHKKYKKYNQEDMLQHLRDLKEKLGYNPRKYELEKYNFLDYCSHFNTYKNALVSAGLVHPLKNKKITQKDIVDEIKRIRKKIGHYPNTREFLENSPITSYQIFNNSWSECLEQAGFTPKDITKKDIKNALWNRYRENGNNIDCLEYWSIRKSKSFPYSPFIIKSRFDNKPWDEIMVECGFEYTSFNHFCGGGHRRGQFTGRDGNEYLSTIERNVGNLLYEMKNNGEIDEYEYEALVCKERNWTCDFRVKIGERIIFVEVDGLINSRNVPYKNGNEKINYYKNNDLEHCVISYRDFDLKKRLSYFLY